MRLLQFPHLIHYLLCYQPRKSHENNDNDYNFQFSFSCYFMSKIVINRGCIVYSLKKIMFSLQYLILNIKLLLEKAIRLCLYDHVLTARHAKSQAQGQTSYISNKIGIIRKKPNTLQARATLFCTRLDESKFNCA